MSDPAPEARRDDATLPLVQREVILVLVLGVVAVILFLATRSLAQWSRAAAEEVAATWYERGRALVAEGRSAEGIAALRRAVAAERSDVEYTLALVRALEAGGSPEEARQLLIRLRELEPEQAEINYRLAGLAAARGEIADAVRYYNHALYGAGLSDEGLTRRQILRDLAALQIVQGDADGARATLGTLARETPDDPAAQTALGRLYASAGQFRLALARYSAALARSPGDVDALAGAADAAFALRDFAGARRFLVRARDQGADGEALTRRINLLQLVVSHDPLAAGVSMTERVRRLTAGLDWTARRLDVCREASGQPAPDLEAEIQRFRQQPRADLRDTDVLAAGVALIARAVADVTARCGATDSLDEVWTTIGRSRGAAQ